MDTLWKQFMSPTTLLVYYDPVSKQTLVRETDGRMRLVERTVTGSNGFHARWFMLVFLVGSAIFGTLIITRVLRRSNQDK